MRRPSSVSSLSSGRPIWFLALWTVPHLIKSYPGAASSSPVLPLLSQLHAPKLVRQGTLLSLFQYLTSPDLLSAPQQPSNLYLLPFQPLIVLRSSPSLQLSGQLDCITATSLNNGIKHLVSMLSLDPDDFPSHSLRRGGATFAFQCGIPSELIKLQGDWRSDAYMLYLTLPLADRLVLSQLIKQHIQSL